MYSLYIFFFKFKDVVTPIHQHFNVDLLKSGKSNDRELLISNGWEDPVGNRSERTWIERLCSKFTYKYHKRPEHDFSYISTLVFLDVSQPDKLPPSPPLPVPPKKTNFPSPYLQNLFSIVTSKLVMDYKLSRDASLSILPGYITGIPYVSN